MKTVLTRILTISGVALLMLASCTKNDPKVVSNGGNPGTLSASTSSVVLNKANSSDSSGVLTFSLTAATYNFKAAESSSIQIDSIGDNWAKPATITLGAGVTTQALSTSTLNSALLQIVPGGVTSKVNVRVRYGISSEVASYSNVLSLTVTPYTLASYIYIVGAFQGWNAASPDSLVSNTSNGIYTGTFTFPAGAGNNQFLILPAKNYNNKYATNDPTSQVPSATVAYNAPNNFNAPAAAGAYTVTFNLNALTIGFSQ